MPSAALPEFHDATPDGRPRPTSPYGRLLHATLDELFAAYPTFATAVGHHAFDDRWPEVSEAGRQARLRRLRRLRDGAAALDEQQLDGEAGELIDRGILLDALDGLLFEEQTLREDAWDPLGYVRLVGDGLFDLLGREFAPWDHRGTALAWRIARLPAVLEGARANLVGLPDRPVSLLHLETALTQLGGLPELIDEALAEADRRHEAGEADLATALRAVRPAALDAIASYRSFLDGEARAHASGDGRLGPRLFEQKLRRALSSEIGASALLARARRDYDLIRAEMARLAGLLWAAWSPQEAPPADPDALVRAVLDRIAGEHPRADALLEVCRAEVDNLEAFVRDRGLVGLPDDPLRIAWTPTFQRAYGGAFLAPPGPLDRGQASYFWITPPGDDWPEERVESYLREDNDRMLRLLCIHEAVPGHYLQLAWANRCPSLTRSVFADGTFAEGWAVYVTQIMMDAGYAADDPAVLLTHWKFYLRSVTNTIMDVGIHTGGMTEAEAMELMVGGGFQEEQEARAKWLRARLTSTQLSTYYLGSLELWDLEREARRRAAQAAGADGSAVAEPALVGGFGSTPGFDQRAHLEAVLSHGTPPIPWLRRILLGG